MGHPRHPIRCAGEKNCSRRNRRNAPMSGSRRDPRQRHTPDGPSRGSCDPRERRSTPCARPGRTQQGRGPKPHGHRRDSRPRSASRALRLRTTRKATKIGVQSGSPEPRRKSARDSTNPRRAERMPSASTRRVTPMTLHARDAAEQRLPRECALAHHPRDRPRWRKVPRRRAADRRPQPRDARPSRPAGGRGAVVVNMHDTTPRLRPADPARRGPELRSGGGSSPRAGSSSTTRRGGSRCATA